MLGVEQVGRWLEEFHPRSLVELDYGGLVHLLGAEALAAEGPVGGRRGGDRRRCGPVTRRRRSGRTRPVTARWRRVLALRAGELTRTFSGTG